MSKRRENAMAQCEVCKNEYDKAFQITVAGGVHTFDSFECAIHALAPVCAHCGCKVVGHGVEAEGTIYCCANCARVSGKNEIVDRVA
jgi:hypothetical protein